MKEKILKLIEYLADEEKNFYENCSCPEEVQETQDFNKCTCEENKNHIYRVVDSVKEWVENPSCPLFDKEEIEEEIGAVK